MGVHNFVLGAAACIRYSLCVASTAAAPDLKHRVAEFWDREPCGTRYLNTENNFQAHAQARYALEPHIPDFAKFAESRGLRVLEIGVGLGADYEEWLKAGAIATGVDLSEKSLAQTRSRCENAELAPDLSLADAESLPFPDQTFDVIYSYGVMHHSPDTAGCVREAKRVLKYGGEARIMLYHHASITGFLLWLRYGLWRGQSVRRCVYERLESPGTQTFTLLEALEMFQDFESVHIEQVFSPGDLLLHSPSARFQGRVYRWIWKLFPRSLVRKFGKQCGLFLLITAKKRPRRCAT